MPYSARCATDTERGQQQRYSNLSDSSQVRGSSKQLSYVIGDGK
jgi:hypothetical protein